MRVNTYYRDELNYLREMGDLFAKANPRLSKHLSKDATDPDVERLMEGFAFLVGRLRQRLDAEMPEIAHSLLKLIWPHYLRPVAPITTLQFKCTEGAGPAGVHVPRGTIVQSAPVDGEPVPFKTSYDLTALPFSVDAVDLELRKDSCRLSLTIANKSGNGLQALAAAPLTIFFNSHRDDTVARQLYLFFMQKVRAVQLTPKGGDSIRLSCDIAPVGFAEGEATLPYPPGAFHGFRVMQEYFSCPEKFMYARIKGLEKCADIQTESFDLSFEMAQPFPETTRLTPEHFVLNATPAINLFETEGQALMVAHDRSEYPVRAIGGGGRHSVQTIKSVTGRVQGSGRRIDYEPFESFRHDTGVEADNKLYYRAQIRPAVLGEGIDHYISFVTRTGASAMPETETISTELVCSSGKRASELAIGAVNKPTSSTPSKLDFTNVTPVLSEVTPPLNDEVQWTLIANLARNFSSLIDVDALRTVVAAYDFRANTDKLAAQQRDLLLRSFQRFERRGIDIVRRGRPVRAHELALYLSEGQLGGDGEMFLFGTVLDQFLKSYSSINSLHRFSITGTDTNTSYTWSPKWGEAATL